MDHRLSIVNSNHSQDSNANVNSKLIIQQASRLDSGELNLVSYKLKSSRFIRKIIQPIAHHPLSHPIALYTCEAKNEFGVDETNIQLIVTGRLENFQTGRHRKMLHYDRQPNCQSRLSAVCFSRKPFTTEPLSGGTLKTASFKMFIQIFF